MLKAAQAPRVDTQQLVKATTQAMSCMHVGTKKLASDQETREKPLLGINRPPELSKGLAGSLDPNLSCQYCKDTGHKKENCRQLQKKMAHDHLATQEHELRKQQPPLGMSPINGDKIQGSPDLKIDNVVSRPQTSTNSL